MKTQVFTARFLRRPNRFLGVVELDGEEVYTFIPNPGRMYELMIPGRTVYIRRASNKGRKTAYDMIAIDHDGLLVSLDANLPNRFIRRMLEEGGLPHFSGYDRVVSEPALYGGRADFRLDGPDSSVMIEVKSCTLVEGRRALFPDAVTSRGARHMHHLAKALDDGLVDSAAALFVIQRPDADVFSPHWRMDPEFSKALLTAHERGVRVIALLTELENWSLRFLREIPIDLSWGL